MTPADRDRVRALAQAIVDGAPCTDVEQAFAPMILRYMPAGDVEHPAVTRIDDEPDIPPEFRLSVVLYRERRLQPCSARFVAAALHAAADAAEES